LVAHRLSTVRTSDRVAFVDRGSITGLGTYNELVLENEAFRAMVASSG
jgi:ATP-binding cassette, subfamily B, bacterial AbcA/BmrA